jgi:hypothetical protein
MILKEVGTVTMTAEAIDKIEAFIKKEKEKIESWDAKDFIFHDTVSGDMMRDD